ncbi:putative Quinolinate synthetase [Nitrospira lenta]|uniref:Putative Quinolinate synthetase n=1 Tax=Nitrospira lenta TaxID=1436998 RepID=A0A330L183_9BACT|nr:putative Quinolinate synthetase [Nitrospira lenta]
MPKYAVMLEGEGCLIKLQKRPLGKVRAQKLERRGFFTTRFVEASDETEARKEAVRLVRDEIDSLICNEPNDPWKLSIDEVWEDPEEFDARAPGKGCTWY